MVHQVEVLRGGLVDLAVGRVELLLHQQEEDEVKTLTVSCVQLL